MEGALLCQVACINWHATEKPEAVLCADFHPRDRLLLATGGFDKCIKLWSIDETRAIAALRDERQEDKTLGITFLAAVIDEKTEQVDGVNDVKWSPHGELLAGAYDDGSVVLFLRDPTNKGNKGACDSHRQYNAEGYHYKTHQVLRNNEAIYCIAFSPTSQHIVSGGMRGAVAVHDTRTGQVVASFASHEKHCQGVAYDPLGKCFVSVSADRSVQFYTAVPSASTGSHHHHQQASSVHYIISASATRSSDDRPLFKGEMASFFFRRSSFSPDGLFVAVPCGVSTAASRAPASTTGAASPTTTTYDCVHLFSRVDHHRPFLSLCVSGSGTVLGAKFAPCAFQIDQDQDSQVTGADPLLCAWGPSTHKLALAIWTAEEVIVYVSDQAGRFCSFRDLHYDKISDVSWSRDARFLVVTSLDGFVTLCYFHQPLGSPTELTSIELLGPVKQSKLDACRSTETALAQDAAAVKASVTHNANVRKKKRERTPEPDLPVADAELLASLL